MNRETGTYQTVDYNGRQFEAFIPHPLPPAQQLELDEALSNALASALFELGRLEGIAMWMDDKHIFLYQYIRQEAVQSSQIEGAHSTLPDLFKYEVNEPPEFQDVIEVSNYVQAIEHGLRRLRDDGWPVTNRLLREMHAILLASGRGGDKRPGEFRDFQNAIQGKEFGEIAFVPPPPFEVESCMHHLEIFLNDDNSGIHPLIKAGLAHAQFETIHPFLDGNGRLGRLLITFYLCHENILSYPLLYLSLYLRQHRDSYIEHLNNVRVTGDWESWLKFFLEGVRSTAWLAVETASSIGSLLDEDAKKITQHSYQSKMPLRLHTLLKTTPILTVAEATKRLDTSFKTASTAMKALCEVGIVEEIESQGRSRLYAYQDYIDLLTPLD